MMKEKFDGFKQHLEDNKKVYITGGVCLVVGVIAGAFAMATRPEMKVISDSYNLKINSPTTTTIEFLERSTPSKQVHQVGTKKYWDSIHETARDTGLNRALISRNVNGHIEHVNGDVFELVDSQ